MVLLTSSRKGFIIIKMKVENLENQWWFKVIRYFLDIISGPFISAVLTNFALKNPSEWLTGFIYFLGFYLSGLKLWLSVKHRKLEFLEKMVYRKQKKGDEELEGGIIDSNSVGITEWVSKI